MEDKKLTYTDFINMVRDDMKAKNADRATRKNLYVIAKNKYEDYLKGENNKMEEKKYVNEEGQFDFKKFVADGALEKNLNEIGMFNDPMGYDSGAAAEDKRAIAQIKDLIEKGVPRDEAIQKVADEFGLRFHYLAKRVNEVKNKDRYIEKHGPIFKVDNEEKIDFLQSITDPSGYGYDDADYAREDALYDEAEALGTLPQLKRMLGITHWGREGGLNRYDPRNRKDPLGYRNQKKTYRFKKDGDMYSVDKASMKSTAAGKLKDLKKQSQVMKDKGRQLPEFTLKEIDEMLKESRSKDNK